MEKQKESLGHKLLVLIGWSGEQSKAVAKALRNWLPIALHDVRPFMSSEDLRSGKRWREELGSNLYEAQVGIFCITPENRDSIWMHFEAGAISRMVDQSKAVVPYLLGLTATDLIGPLSDFTARDGLVLEDNLALYKDLFKMLPDPPDFEPELAFSKVWADLKVELEDIQITPSEEHRPDRSILEEILERIRSLPGKPKDDLFGNFGPQTIRRMEHLVKLTEQNTRNTLLLMKQTQIRNTILMHPQVERITESPEAPGEIRVSFLGNEDPVSIDVTEVDLGDVESFLSQHLERQKSPFDLDDDIPF